MIQMRYLHHDCASCFFECKGRHPCQYFEPLYDVTEWDERNMRIMLEKEKRKYREAWLEYAMQYDDDYLLDRANDFEYK